MGSNNTPQERRQQIWREAGIDPATVPADMKTGVEVLADRIEALSNKVDRLEAALKRATDLADRDPLCPVFNRRAFLRELVREIAVAERHSTELSVVYLDLVAFKRINDEFGHAAGDGVLKSVATVLIDNTRQTDITGRLGGDEFAVALPRASLEDAIAKAAELTDLIAGVSAITPNGSSGQHALIAASSGCASWAPGMDAETLLARADRHLYESRSNGASSARSRGHG